MQINKYLLFTIIIGLVATIKCDIQDDDHERNGQLHRLWFNDNSAELILNTSEIFSLNLKPELLPDETDLEIKFNCEDDDDNNFDWNSKESNCTVIKLKDDKYTFTITKNETKLNLTVITLVPGKQQLVAHARFIGQDQSDDVDVRKAYITINVGRSNTILTISAIIGWIYFVAWSISFYPQIWENFQRKSVVGLNFDFIALNLTGFLSYSAYNIAIKYIPSVEDEFFRKHPRSQNPIELNDVVFGVHAMFATIIVIVQCFIYERSNQKVAIWAKIYLAVVYAGYIIIGIMVSFKWVIGLLDYIYIFSYVKLSITIIKYIPQAWFNYRRKSTVGWSIGNIFLDFTGGLLSMFQMFMLAYNYDDWITIMNNFTKFGLGMISILFDVLFLLQHYVFFRNGTDHSSQSALLANQNGDQSTLNVGASNEKENSVPSLVNHINYGATDSINTNNAIDGYSYRSVDEDNTNHKHQQSNSAYKIA